MPLPHFDAGSIMCLVCLSICACVIVSVQNLVSTIYFQNVQMDFFKFGRKVNINRIMNWLDYRLHRSTVEVTTWPNIGVICNHLSPMAINVPPLVRSQTPDLCSGLWIPSRGQIFLGRKTLPLYGPLLEKAKETYYMYTVWENTWPGIGIEKFWWLS